MGTSHRSTLSWKGSSRRRYRSTSSIEFRLTLLIAVFLAFAPAALTAGVRISDLVVTGAYRTGEQYVRKSILLDPSREYDSTDEIERRLELTKARLMSTGVFLMVDYFVAPVSDDEVEVYVNVTEQMVPTIDTGMALFLFNNIPARGLRGGMYADGPELGIAISPATPQVVQNYNLIGFAFLPEDNYGAAARTGLLFDLSPEINAGVDASYVLRIENPIDANNHDVALGAGATVDLEYLKQIYHVGIKARTDNSVGLWSYRYVHTNDIVTLYIKEFDFTETAARANYYAVRGAYPDYLGANVRYGEYYRGPTAATATSQRLVFNFEQRLIDLFVINAVYFNVSLGVHALFDLGITFDDATDLATGPWDMAVGGGIRIGLGIPFNLYALLDYSVDPRDATTKLHFAVGDYF